MHELIIGSKKSKFLIFFFDRNRSCNELQNTFKFICLKHSCLYDCSCAYIEVSSALGYLGLIIGKQLQWGAYIQLLSNRLRKINYFLYFMRGFLKPEHLRQLYTS